MEVPKSVTSGVHRYLTCPICTELFSDPSDEQHGAKIPRFLQCGHTFCSACLAKNVLFTPSKKPGKVVAKISCPQCRESTKVIVSKTLKGIELEEKQLQAAAMLKLGKNFTILQMRDKSSSLQFDLVRETQKEEKISSAGVVSTQSCENCGASASLCFCDNCQAIYCKSCFDSLHMNKVMSRHSSHPVPMESEESLPPDYLQAASPSAQLCPEHGIPLTLFCFNEKIVICSSCCGATGSHHGHKVGTIPKAARELKNSLEAVDVKGVQGVEALNKVQQLLEGIQKQKFTECSQAREELLRAYDKLLALVFEHRKRTLAIVDQEFFSKSEHLADRCYKVSIVAAGLMAYSSKSKECIALPEITLLKNCIQFTSDYHKAVVSAAGLMKAAQEEFDLLTASPVISGENHCKFIERASEIFNKSISSLPEAPETPVAPASLPSEPNLPPISAIKIDRSGESSVRISWSIDDLKLSQPDGQFPPNFIVQHFEGTQKDFEENHSEESAESPTWDTIASTNDLFLSVEELSMTTTHLFRVCYRTNYGYSSWSQVQTWKFEVAPASLGSPLSVSSPASIPEEKVYEKAADDMIPSFTPTSIKSEPASASSTLVVSGTELDDFLYSTSPVPIARPSSTPSSEWSPRQSFGVLASSSPASMSPDLEKPNTVNSGLLSSEDRSWKLSESQVVEFKNLFSHADKDKDGFVGGSDAVEFFTMSNLPKSSLSKIWLLSDMDVDGRLNLEEFVVAMALIVCHKKHGVPIPEKVPPVLLAQISK